VRGLGPVLLRFVLGAVFIAHGANKLFGAWAGPAIGAGGLSGTAAFLATLHLEPAFALAVLLGVTEFAGGIFLVLGFHTRWASLALVISMGVAIWRVHWQVGFFMNWNSVPNRGEGMEYGLVLIAALLCMAMTGAGDFSVDGRNAQSAAVRAAGRARLRGKV